jgi:chromosome segregation protein
VAGEHNRVFVRLREMEHLIEAKRGEHKSRQQQLNRSQSDYYHAVAEVGSLEQAVRHSENSRQETSREIERTRQLIEQSGVELETDWQQFEAIKESLSAAEEELLIAEERQQETLLLQQESQQKMRSWQQQWETYRTENAKCKEQAEVQRVKAQHLEDQNRQLQIRMDRLQSERSELESSHLQNEIEALESQIEMIEVRRSDLRDQLEELHQRIRSRRQQLKQIHDDLHGRRSELQSVRGKITSLELLQQHAMGKDNKKLSVWLESVHLQDNRRLAEFLEVQSGWERAVETVLGGYLDAICLDSAEQAVYLLQSLDDESVTLFETGAGDGVAVPAQGPLAPLLDKIASPWSLSGLLTGVYCAETAETARALSAKIKPYESVVTPDGAWFGPGWVKIIRDKDSKAGVLQREKELRQLKLRQDELRTEIAGLEEALENTEAGLKEAEVQRDQAQQQDSRLGNELAVKSAEFSAQSARLEQQQRRLEHVLSEIEDIFRDTVDNSERLAEWHTLQEQAERNLLDQELKKQNLEAVNEELARAMAAAEQAVGEARHQVYSVKTRIETLRSSETSLVRQIERLQTQHQASGQRIQELEHKLQQTVRPLDDEKARLHELQFQKEGLEEQLKAHRTLQEQLEAEVTQLSEEQARLQRSLERQKELLDAKRFELQESQVRQQTVKEQLREIEADPETVLEGLPEQADEQAWKKRVDDLTAQIERLGTINLTAIEEYKSQSERMSFLNAQHVDLVEALQTLEQAINKIDKESRLRFKETFDKINNGLQEKFPKLFGGGQAYLELTEQDALEAGVAIIARPPGKRNSSIHLLSGGEKALTAVALVFSIFELNPAPFCLLDEVDAPLDDANVGRFSKMVEEMSASVQFLYISHNKATMEIAQQLAGVTMKEPGVSRMVAVDIEEAVSLAET